MKRLSLLVACAAAAMSMFAMPVLAAVSDDGPVAIERLDCPPADFTTADFAVDVVAPAAEWFTCHAALLAETGFCVVEVEQARVGFAFAPPPDPAFVPAAAGTCLSGRSPTG